MRAPGKTPAGFTLVELLVVMGLLGILGALLLQLFSGGLEIWSRGEAIRALLEQGASVADLAASDLERIRGSGDGPTVRGRLLAAPIRVKGVDWKGGEFPAWRFLRSTSPRERAAAPASWTRGKQEKKGTTGEPGAEGGPPPASRESEGDTALEILFPFASRYESLEPGVYLSLRRGLVPGKEASPYHPWFSSTPFPSLGALLDQTQEVTDGLIYFSLRFWAQDTQDWDSDPSEGGAQVWWDSTRGGGTLDAPGGGCGLDLGPWSLKVPWDDVFPRALLLEFVLDQPPGEARCAVTREPLEAAGKGPLWVDYPERLGWKASEGGYVKIEGEWIRYRELRGATLLGLTRGVRGTKAAAHPAGKRIHVGWTVRRVIPLSQPRDWWGPLPQPPENKGG